MPRARTDEWWRNRLQLLQQLAVETVRTAPGVVYEKSGFWPAIKLIVMQYALGFYAPIMRAQVSAGGWDSLHYIDTNAGNGINHLTSKANPDCDRLVAGTALIGANTVRFASENKHFDRFHFIEPIRKHADALDQRLASFLPHKAYRLYREPASTAIPKIVHDLSEDFDNPHFFAVVDPEGLKEVTLPDLKPLLSFGRGDVLFNFQYMAPKRYREAGKAFFGDPDWDDSMTENEIRDYFLDRLKALGRPVAETFTVTAGKGSGRYEYDFVYCASRTLAGSPWVRNLRAALAPYIDNIKGSDVDQVFCAGQTTLF